MKEIIVFRIGGRLKEIIVQILLNIPEKYDLKSVKKIREYRKLCNPIGSVGEGTYGINHIIIHAWNIKHKVHIGNYCSIADNVHIFLGGNHHMYRTTTFPFSKTSSEDNLFGTSEDEFLSKGDIQIGHDVHIGSNVSIMSGLNIGSGSAIAAFSHVTRDVHPYEIVGGNPAGHIKFRFGPEIIQDLLELEWWDWPKHKIISNLEFLLNPPQDNLHMFNKKYTEKQNKH
jgi:acetyltransferase-like isoleucine patch superfamily enzyme